MFASFGIICSIDFSAASFYAGNATHYFFLCYLFSSIHCRIHKEHKKERLHEVKMFQPSINIFSNSDDK